MVALLDVSVSCATECGVEIWYLVAALTTLSWTTRAVAIAFPPCFAVTFALYERTATPAGTLTFSEMVFDAPFFSEPMVVGVSFVP